jgi:RNA polymerase sigma-70 factor (ECF subfamily)
MEFEGWLATIAGRQTLNAVDRLRRHHRVVAVQGAVPSTAVRSSWLNLAERFAASSETPSARVAGDEAVQAMQVAVATLPEAQRAAVMLHHLEGKSVDSTAAQLGRSSGAVRGLLQRARHSLRDMMGNSSRWFHKKP